MVDFLNKIVILIVAVVGEMGYLGIVFLMFLESSFFPFPSEIVIVPAGYLASQGQMNLYLVIITGILGSILGAVFNYFIAVKFGRPVILKYGKYVGLSENAFDRVESFFRQHGEISTFVGRLIPGIRQYISFPAGLARMNLGHFVIFTGLGAGIWVVILAFIGFYVGNNQEMISEYIRQSTLYLIGFSALLLYIYYWRHKRRKLSESDGA